MPSNYANVNVKDEILTKADANNDDCDLPHPYVFSILNEFNRDYLPSHPNGTIKYDSDNHFGY
jgi:hypothetical protein